MSAPDARPGGRGSTKLQRIVACVKACTGIEDPETTIPELVALLRTELESYEEFKGSGGELGAEEYSWMVDARAVLEKVNR